MEMNDKTILRIKVPAHLYESVKAQLTLNEAKGKQNLGAGMEVVKEKKNSGGDKPKKTSAPKKANAPVKVTDDNTPKADKDIKGASVTEKKTPKDGHKKMGLDELKTLAELLNGHIAKMEGKKEDIEEYREDDEIYPPIEDKPKKEAEEKIEESTEQLNEEEYDVLQNLKSAGAYTEEDIFHVLFGSNADYQNITPDQQKTVDYYHDLMGSYGSSRLGQRRGFRR